MDLQDNISLSLLFVAMLWNQPSCSRREKWIRKTGYIYIMEFFHQKENKLKLKRWHMWVKITSCSCRGPEVCSQPLSEGSQPTVTPGPENLMQYKHVQELEKYRTQIKNACIWKSNVPYNKNKTPKLNLERQRHVATSSGWLALITSSLPSQKRIRSEPSPVPRMHLPHASLCCSSAAYLE